MSLADDPAMDEVPLVAVITPTWRRHKMLLQRCIPSVQAQGYPRVEHIVVSDGPDPELARRLATPWRDGWRHVWYRELPEHARDDHYGHYARAAALELTEAAYITYCDDDDFLRPLHCSLLARALDENPDCGFAVSQMDSHGPYGITTIGAGELAAGNVGTPMIMHRKRVTDIATWDHADVFEDWDLVWSWIKAGVPYARVDLVTSDVWPSAYRGPAPDPDPEPPHHPGLVPGEARPWPDGTERAQGGHDLARTADLARPQP